MDVSIIIPTYNRLWSLPKAIESCRDTSLVTEIIVVDDGSTDGTWEWLEQQPDLVTMRQENQGKDWAVNNGFAIAKGKYIRFLDSDDWFLPNSTDELFKKAVENDLDITCAGYQVFDAHETFIKEISWTACDDFLAQQLGECDSSHYSAYLFKKEFIKDIPHRQEYGSRDDRQFVIEAALKGPLTGYISSPALAHRMHNKEKLQLATGVSAAVNDLAILMIYKRTFTILATRNQLTQRYKNAATNLLWHLAHWVAKTDLQKAKEIYRWVYELNPDFKAGDGNTISKYYKILGFSLTERIFSIRRAFFR